MNAFAPNGGRGLGAQGSFSGDEYGPTQSNDVDLSIDIPSILATKIDSLPSLPAVATQVLQTVADPKSTAVDLNRIISSDVSLTATILKIANSPLFGFPRKVSSLEQALKILGFAEVQNLVLTKAVFNSFRNVKSSGQLDVRRFWEHAFVCGLAARLLGKAFGLKGTDAFVAGLIHDIGKLVLYTALPVPFSEMLQSAEADDSKASCVEKGLISHVHDKIGMDILQRWMFPKSLVTAVGYHHRPKKATEYQLLTTIVYLADLLAHRSEQGPVEKDLSVEDDLIHPDTIGLCRSQGLQWDTSVCENVLEELVDCREEQRATINVFFS